MKARSFRCVLGTAGMLFVVTSGAAFAHISAPDEPRHRFAERHMGTLFQVTIAGDVNAATNGAKRAFARAKELDDKLSDYKADSELMRLCDKAGTGPVKVSDDLFAVMTDAQRIAKASDGAFDVTIGPIVRLWRLARRTRELPVEKELNDALTKVGHAKIVLGADSKTITLAQTGMKLDLGGIAKGYAAEEMIKVLRDHGCPRALVAAGGDIVAGDAPSGAAGWSVSIAALEPGEQTQTILLANAAISTSGDAEQYVEIAGKRYAHIVNPKTGLGLTDHFAVTVLAKNGATADALATAAAVLGPERGLKLIETFPGASARFVLKVGDKIEVRKSSGFRP